MIHIKDRNKNTNDSKIVNRDKFKKKDYENNVFIFVH